MVETTKYSYIDSIRGYAVLMVLVTHVFAFMCNADQSIFLSKFWVQCRMGVMLFYMISALTLFLSFNQKKNFEKKPVRNFFIRRIFRIVPLFYLVCIYRIFTNDFDSVSIFTTITFTNSFLPDRIHGIVEGGWSIVIEMIFYLMVPFLFRYLTGIKPTTVFIIGTIVLCILLRVAAFRILPVYYSNDTLLSWTLVWLPVQLPVFGMGILIYFLLFRSGFSIQGQDQFYRTLSYLLAIAGIYLFIMGSYSTRLFMYESIALSVPLLLFIIGLCIYPGNYLNNKLTQFMGKISYSFYFLHFLMITLLNYIGNRMDIHFAGNKAFVIYTGAVFLLTTGLAYLTYRFVEQPFQRMGSAWIRRLESERTLPITEANKQ